MTEPHGSEEVTENDQPQGENETPPTEPQGDEVAKIKAESRKWEARAKKDAQALAELQKQLTQMVSPDQVADKDAALAQALATAEAATISATKYRIALAEGLPADLADRLLGTSEEELAEDAKRLKALVKPSAPGRDAKGGQVANNQPQKQNPNDLIRLIARG